MYDAIILGAGHNGLIVQACLARAGWKTICLESRPVPGGGLTTIEYPSGSGYLHNTHSFYHRGLTTMPWFGHLELEKHGANYLCPQLNVALVLDDQRCLEWWGDFDQTVESFAKFNRRDAATMRRWRDRFAPRLCAMLRQEAESPPIPPHIREERLAADADGRLLLEVSRLSPRQFVQQEFEDPAVQAALLFFNGLREVDLRAPGFGHHIPMLLASGRMAEICVGGSHELAKSLVRCVEHHGGTVQCNTRPRRIVVDKTHGHVVGVETVEGQLLHGRTVVSSLNPQQTFLQLIDPKQLPAEWRRMAEDYQYNVLAPLFAVHLNLKSPPNYRASEQNEHLNDALMVILGIEDARQFDKIAEAHDSGQMPPTVMWGSCPTRFDSSQAPTGCHTSFMWQKVPYHLMGDSSQWQRHAEQHVETMLTKWTQYAPDLPTSIVDCFARTPLEIPQTLENMQDGDLLVGALTGGQVGYHRPFPGAGHYRTCFEGLYLAGSCCHPGGNITGLPGYNAYQVICADRIQLRS